MKTAQVMHTPGPWTLDAMKHENTQVGFKWGPAVVSRLCDDTKHGVWLEIAGAKEHIEIRVTKSGKLRVGPVRKQSTGPSVGFGS